MGQVNSKLTGCVNCELESEQSPFSSKSIGMNTKQVNVWAWQEWRCCRHQKTFSDVFATNGLQHCHSCHAQTLTCLAFFPTVFKEKRDCSQSTGCEDFAHLDFLEECFTCTYRKVLFKPFFPSVKTQLLSSWKCFCNPCYKAHATPHSPGIEWQASLRTSSKAVRVTEAPNLMPSVVCFTAFNSGMWVGAIRTG